MNTNSIVREQKEKMRTDHVVDNDRLGRPYTLDIPVISSIRSLEENGYSCTATTLGNPIELIRRNSHDPSSCVTAGYKANMEKKTSIFSKVKAIFKI
jgi:hypothetical protein